MTLESSETEFASRYAAFAAQGTLYPGREGSPLLEFSAGGRVLYLFDRSGPYAARPGPARPRDRPRRARPGGHPRAAPR